MAVPASGSYRNMGDGPIEVNKGDKRVMIEPGGFIDLSSEDVTENKCSIDEEILTPVAVGNKGAEKNA